MDWSGGNEILWWFGGRTGYVGLGGEPNRDGLCVCGGGRLPVTQCLNNYAHAE